MTSVQIVSVGHSGSSILNLVLGSHPSLFSVGELWSVEEFWENDVCACGQQLNKCHFWTKIRNEVSNDNLNNHLRKGSFSRRKGSFLLNLTDFLIIIGCKSLLELYSIFSKNMRETLDSAEQNLRLINKIAQDKNSIVVDSSKNPIRAKLLSTLDDRTKIIYLIRDGRGVSLSWTKAYYYTFKKAVLQWMMRDLLIKIFLVGVRKKNKLILSYENFCQNPIETCIKICEFLDINFDEDMLSKQKEKRHDVHINPNSFKNRFTIKLDEKWKNLNLAQIKSFNTIAGIYNYINGYKPKP